MKNVISTLQKVVSFMWTRERMSWFLSGAWVIFYCAVFFIAKTHLDLLDLVILCWCNWYIGRTMRNFVDSKFQKS